MTGIIALPMQSFVIRMKWVSQKYKQKKHSKNINVKEPFSAFQTNWI